MSYKSPDILSPISGTMKLIKDKIERELLIITRRRFSCLYFENQSVKTQSNLWFNFLEFHDNSKTE